MLVPPQLLGVLLRKISSTVSLVLELGVFRGGREADHIALDLLHPFSRSGLRRCSGGAGHGHRLGPGGQAEGRAFLDRKAATCGFMELTFHMTFRQFKARCCDMLLFFAVFQQPL